jgi:hypothetical protein
MARRVPSFPPCCSKGQAEREGGHACAWAPPACPAFQYARSHAHLGPGRRGGAAPPLLCTCSGFMQVASSPAHTVRPMHFASRIRVAPQVVARRRVALADLRVWVVSMSWLCWTAMQRMHAPWACIAATMHAPDGHRMRRPTHAAALSSWTSGCWVDLCLEDSWGHSWGLQDWRMLEPLASLKRDVDSAADHHNACIAWIASHHAYAPRPQGLAPLPVPLPVHDPRMND